MVLVVVLVVLVLVLIGISRIIECIDIVCIEPYRIDSG
jgi:hypothetical protein